LVCKITKNIEGGISFVAAVSSPPAGPVSFAAGPLPGGTTIDDPKVSSIGNRQ